MAYSYGTLAQETDGKVGYIYPKTVSNLVECNDGKSVETRLTQIDKDLVEVNARITNLVNGIEYGSLGTKNDTELFDIRVPNYNVVPEDTTYNSAGEAIRGQFQIIIDKLNSLQKDIDEIKNSTILMQ